MKRNFNFQSNTVVIPKKIVDIGQTTASPDQPPTDLVDFPFPVDYKKGYYFIPHKLKASNQSISKLKKEKQKNDLYSIPDDFGFTPDEDNPLNKPISAILSGINSSTIRTPKVLGYTTKIKNEKKMKKKYIGEESSVQSNYPTFLVSPANTKQLSQVDRVKQEIEESRKKLGIEYSKLKADPRVTNPIKINTKVPEPRRSLMGQSQSQKSLHIKRNYESWNASPEIRHKLGSVTLSAGNHTSHSSIILPSINMQHSRKATKLTFGSESEERGIKNNNLKIRNIIKNGMKPSVSCENLKKILLNQANYFHSPQAQPVAMETERAPILVLLDKELMFIKDYMDDLRYSLRMVFDKVESYEYMAQKDKQMDLTKKNQLPSYACVFIFLKCYPSPSKSSINVFNEMSKKHVSYLVKCSMGEKNDEAEAELEALNLTQRSASTMQHSLILGCNKFKTHFVPYEEYQGLQNFIISKSKGFDVSKTNSVARSSS